MGHVTRSCQIYKLRLHIVGGGGGECVVGVGGTLVVGVSVEQNGVGTSFHQSGAPAKLTPKAWFLPSQRDFN